MRTGGDELELATSQPTATVALTDGTHAFRIRRNQAITNAIAAVTSTSMANQRTEKRSGAPVPAPWTGVGPGLGSGVGTGVGGRVGRGGAPRRTAPHTSVPR